MKKLRVCVVDLVSRGPCSLFMRVMAPNLASIMPQAVAAWCSQEGHEIAFVLYTGAQALSRAVPAEADLVFICAFTEAAQMAYALSLFCRARGAITALGGPHARCYPQDALQYFDYILGFTDRAIIGAVLDDCAAHRPLGIQLSAARQPTALPGMRDRWPFQAAILKQAPLLKIVPMAASLGCPYTCSFCIDAAVPYQPLDFGQIGEDLRFLRTQVRRPVVAWHDPNFGVHFDATLEAIEQAAPPGSILSIAESSLSVLSEPHLARLRRNGFQAILPGIESWFELGNKSRTGAKQGIDKVERVAEHVNQILRYIPYIQTNFVLGLVPLVESHDPMRTPEEKKAKQGPKIEDLPKPRESYAKEYYHSFKDHPEDIGDFVLMGPKADEWVKSEPDGLRIVVSTGLPGSVLSTGVASKFTVKGDFEITLRYELLKEPAQERSGVFLGVDLNTLSYNRATLTRGMRGRQQFFSWFQLSHEGSNKPYHDELRVFPSAGMAGRLRLVRTGSVLSHYVAEGAGDQFLLLRHHPFGTEDVRAIRLGGQTGGALEARLIDLHVRADSLSDMPEAPSAAQETGAKLRRILTASLTILALVFLAVWLYVRRRGACRCRPRPRFP